MWPRFTPRTPACAADDGTSSRALETEDMSREIRLSESSNESEVPGRSAIASRPEMAEEAKRRRPLLAIGWENALIDESANRRLESLGELLASPRQCRLPIGGPVRP